MPLGRGNRKTCSFLLQARIEKTISQEIENLIDVHDYFIRNKHENSLRVRVRNEVGETTKRTNLNEANGP